MSLRAEPIFSIIIPTYERPGPLASCLESLVRLDYPGERFEVIVVDDGSATVPEAVLASIDARLRVSLLVQPNGGPAAARNTGAARAKGRYLAFLDDDCTAAPDWLRVLEARLEAAPDAAVGGRTVNALSGNPYSMASQLLIDYLYAHYNAEPNKAGFLASNNLALRRSGFDTISGFDVGFRHAAGEDRDFCDRWLSRGLRMMYDPEAVVYHAHWLSLGPFWRQHFRYGHGAYSFHRLRRQQSQSRRYEPVSFYLKLLRFPLSHARGRDALRLVALMLLAQAATAAGSVWAAVQRR